MKDLLLEAARAAGADGLDKLEKVIESAVFQQRSAIDDIIDTRLVDEDRFLEELAKKLKFSWEEKLEKEEEKPRRLRELCSAQVALKHRILPIAFEEDAAGPGEGGQGEEGLGSSSANGSGSGTLVVATYDPFNLQARQAAGQLIPVPLRWKISSRTRIVGGLQRLYGVGADTFEQILAGRTLDDNSFDMREEMNIIDEDDEEASVVKFVNQIIREALEQRATDIHVEPLEHSLRIRYRVDGMLVEVPVPENIKSLQDMVIARLKIMSRLDIAERRLPQDGRIALQVEGRPIDVRVATIPTVEGETVSLRLLGQERFTLDKLNLTARLRRVVDQLLDMSNGIVLLTGPTGCGKSTTLYTFLSVLNKPHTRIVTVEDPVENKLEGVMQIAVRSEINLTFANALRSILRADPNIVMIGEMRDLETAEIAIRAALTGHLVFSTLHTNDSISGITRLVDMGVEPFLVGASVRAFIAQRLVRRLCAECKEPTEYLPDYLDSVGFPKGHTGPIFKEVGCRACRNSGFRGRMAIYEICLVTTAMQELVTHSASYSALKEQSLKDGFIPMRDYGWTKVILGETTVDEVISATTTEMKATME
ncbi:MAG TPA: type II/IV secretion system protein [Verrucomicrobiales bacterium]|nr:type II/IV secretion system protein [Verrucomicrobiales bacterium]